MIGNKSIKERAQKPGCQLGQPGERNYKLRRIAVIVRYLCKTLYPGEYGIAGYVRMQRLGSPPVNSGASRRTTNRNIVWQTGHSNDRMSCPLAKASTAVSVRSTSQAEHEGDDMAAFLPVRARWPILSLPGRGTVNFSPVLARQRQFREGARSLAARRSMKEAAN
jgi:hypothetical protein